MFVDNRDKDARSQPSGNIVLAPSTPLPINYSLLLFMNNSVHSFPKIPLLLQYCFLSF